MMCFPRVDVKGKMARNFPLERDTIKIATLAPAGKSNNRPVLLEL